MLNGQTVSQKFLDAGSGSGIFLWLQNECRGSFFDYDVESVSCTRQLKNKYYKNDKIGKLKKARYLTAIFKELGKI